MTTMPLAPQVVLITVAHSAATPVLAKNMALPYAVLILRLVATLNWIAQMRMLTLAPGVTVA